VTAALLVLIESTDLREAPR